MKGLFMDSSRVQAAARKALMAANPLYHAWSPEQQELFRATMDDAASDRVAAVLLSELQEPAGTAENAGEEWLDLPNGKLAYNWADLLTTGIGEDMILLNETMAENVSLLDFETVYDYDLDDYHFQERESSREITDYQKRDYYALRFSLWARLLIDDKLHYATITSLATHITDELEDQGTDMIHRLIPHDYVEGENHGKKAKGGFVWDMRLDAKGLEPQLDELNERWRQYLQQRWIELSQSFQGQAPAAFMMNTCEDEDLLALFVFNNAAALKSIRWRSFLSDCRQQERAFSEVEHHVSEAWKQAEDWLYEAHRDILQNFDPTVTRLRKQRKVTVAPRAFDRLLQRDDDD